MRRVVSAFAVPAVILAVHLNCGERDVPFVVDADEIIAYLQHVGQAKELYNTAGLFPAGSYQVPHQDNAVYQDSVLSHQRTFVVQTVPLSEPEHIVYPRYQYPPGNHREALVEVKDRFTIRTERQYADTSLVDTTVRELVRYAFFLKLGDDSRDYLGWSLWGYNGLGWLNAPLMVTVKTSDNQTYNGNLALYNKLPLSNSSAIDKVPYIELLDITRIENGSVLSLTTEWVGSGTFRDYPLVAADGDGGHYTTALARVTRESYTGAIDTRDGSSNRYDFVLVQSFHDTEFYHTRCWCVPYRLY